MSFESRFQHIDRRVPISENNPAIIHDLTKCKTVHYAVVLVLTLWVYLTTTI